MKCIFLGYTSNQKRCKCYSPTNKRFYTSIDATFFEQKPFYLKSGIQGEKNQEESHIWDQIGDRFWDHIGDKYPIHLEIHETLHEQTPKLGPFRMNLPKRTSQERRNSCVLQQKDKWTG